MDEELHDPLMTQIRRSRGLSLAAVAAEVGTNAANLMRIERGEQVPRHALARALYRYYGGAVPLSAVYDPRFGE